MAGPIIPTSDNAAGPRRRLLPRVFKKCLCRSGIDAVTGAGWCSEWIDPDRRSRRGLISRRFRRARSFCGPAHHRAEVLD